MKQNKWMSLLGLANRAQKVISGEDLVLKEMKNGQVKLVLLSEDASKNTKRKMINKCTYYHIPFKYVNNRYMLGKAIGKEARVVVALTEAGFAKKLASLLDES